MQRKTLTTVHQIVIGAVVASLFVLAIEGLQRHGVSWHLEALNDDGSFSLSLREGRDLLKARGRGKIRYQEQGPQWLEAGARFKIVERVDGMERRLVATPGPSGEPQMAFHVDGGVADFDSAAADWLAGAMKRLYRQVGLDAENRARRIAESGGLDALLDEVSWIRTDSQAATYLDHGWAVASDDGAEHRRILNLAAETLDSDHVLSRWLARVPIFVFETPESFQHWAAAASEVDSDHELLALFEILLDSQENRFPSEARQPDGLDTLVQLAARNLSSDYEANRFVLLLAESLKERAQESLPEALPRLLSQIESDYHLRLAIEGLLDPLPSMAWQETLLGAGREIESDHELTELLSFLGRRRAEPSPLPVEVFSLLASIESGQGFVVAALLGQTAVAGDLPRLLRAPPSGSDAAVAEFLIQLLHSHGAALADQPAFIERLGSVRSSHEQQRVLQAIDAAPLSSV